MGVTQYRARIINHIRASFFVKQIIYYLLFFLLIWFLHMAIVSIGAFFHFILQHPISVIEEWIYDHCWPIIISAKLMAFGIILKFLFIREDSTRSLAQKIRSGIIEPTKEIYVIIVFVLIYIVVLSKIVFFDGPRESIGRMMLSYIATFLFFAIDVVFFFLMDKIYPLTQREKLFRLFSFSFLFWGFGRLIFAYQENFYTFPIFVMIILLRMIDWSQHNWFLPILFIIFAVSPLSSFLGLDPIWRGDYSFVIATEKILLRDYIIMLIPIWFYLRWKNKNLYLPNKDKKFNFIE